MSSNLIENKVNYPSIINLGKVRILALDKEFYTTQEIAGILQLKVPTIYKYVREGKLTAYQFGKNLRFRKEDLEAFLGQHKLQPGELVTEETE